MNRGIKRARLAVFLGLSLALPGCWGQQVISDPPPPRSLPSGAASDEKSATSSSGDSANPTPKDPAKGSQSYSLRGPEMPGTSEGNAHVFFDVRQPGAADFPFLMVWTDSTGYAGSSSFPQANNNPPRKHLSAGERRLKYGGEGQGDEREIKFTYEIFDRERGRFTVDGKDYEIAKGTMILIAAQSGDVSVEQLSRDPTKLPFQRDEVITFGKSDPDINAFFAPTAKSD